jgi:hypothetical protein
VQCQTLRWHMVKVGIFTLVDSQEKKPYSSRFRCLCKIILTEGVSVEKKRTKPNWTRFFCGKRETVLRVTGGLRKKYPTPDATV